MADRSAIEWTDATWNPIRARLRSDPSRVGWHCEHASPGCAGCYAEALNRAGRSRFTGTRLPYKPGHRKDVEIFLDERILLQPLRWRRPRRVFAGSMTDLFADFVTDDMLDRIFAVMALSRQHSFQLLTKRSARMRDYLLTGGWQENWPDNAAVLRKALPRRNSTRQRERGSFYYPYGLGFHPEGSLHLATLPNVWLGVSVEDQQRADERIPDLLATPAAVRFLSCEPLLGPVELPFNAHSSWCPVCRAIVPDSLGSPHEASHGISIGDRFDPARHCASPYDLLHWVIAGGESGPRARPMHPDWARSLRDQCAAAGVPFFFKQWGAYGPALTPSGRVDPRHFRNGKGFTALPGGSFTDRPVPNATFMGRGPKGLHEPLLDGERHLAMPEVPA